MESPSLLQSQQQQPQFGVASTTTQTPPAPATSPNLGASTQSSSTTNLVTVPVPILPHEGTYFYIAVKGSLHAQDCSVFGLSTEEISALAKRYSYSAANIINGIILRGPPINVINLLGQLGYKIISSTGEAEIVWTMQREV